MEKVACQHCGQIVHSEHAVKVEKFIAQGELVLYFCSERCANDFYLERLNGVQDNGV